MSNCDYHQMTIAALRQYLKEAGSDGWSEEMLSILQTDSRDGVQALYQRQLKKKQRDFKELARLTAMRRYEQQVEQEGYHLPAGLDEAGRGPLAGPVVAAAVILPPDCCIRQLNDSKKLSAAVREHLFSEIEQQAVAFGIGMASAREIDEINILQATKLAMKRALQEMQKQQNVVPDFLLLDAVQLFYDQKIPELPLVGGDRLSLSIAAASILAKVTRDRLMLRYHEEFPQYNFAAHKGYGTAEHLQAIAEYGLCPIHRTTFAHRQKGDGSGGAAHNIELGRQGEKMAAEHFIRLGYTVLVQNYRCRFGEIDLVAADATDGRQKVLVFAEVKTRSNLQFGWPEESITAAKQAKIRRLAELFLQQHYYDPTETAVRFDVLLFLQDQQNEKHYHLRHLKGVF